MGRSRRNFIKSAGGAAIASLAGCAKTSSSEDSNRQTIRDNEKTQTTTESEWTEIDEELEEIASTFDKLEQSTSELEQKYSGFVEDDSSQILNDYFAISSEKEHQDTTENKSLQLDSEVIDENEIWYEARKSYIVSSLDENTTPDSQLLKSEDEKFKEKIDKKQLLIAKPSLWSGKDSEAEKEALKYIEDAIELGEDSDREEAIEKMSSYRETFQQLSDLQKKAEKKGVSENYESFERINTLKQNVKDSYSSLYRIITSLETLRPKLKTYKENINEANTNSRFYLDSPVMRNGLPDFNRDGKIDEADIYEFAVKKNSQFIQDFGTSLFDINGDGKVDKEDVKKFSQIVTEEREISENPMKIKLHYDEERRQDVEKAAEIAENVGALINGIGKEVQTKVEIADEPLNLESNYWRNIYNSFDRHTNLSEETDYHLYLSSHEPDDLRGGHSEIPNSHSGKQKASSGVLFADLDDKELPVIGGDGSQTLVHEIIHGLGAQHSDVEYTEADIHYEGEELDLYYCTIMGSGYNQGTSEKAEKALNTIIPSETVRTKAQQFL
jgi:hypothetical protein